MQIIDGKMLGNVGVSSRVPAHTRGKGLGTGSGSEGRAFVYIMP